MHVLPGRATRSGWRAAEFYCIVLRVPASTASFMKLSLVNVELDASCPQVRLKRTQVCSFPVDTLSLSTEYFREARGLSLKPPSINELHCRHSEKEQTKSAASATLWCAQLRTR